MLEEDLKEGPNEKEEELMEEEDPKEDPSEGEGEPLEEEDLAEERVGLTKEENQVRRPEGLEDEGVEEKGGECWTGVISWRRGKCGRMCRGECLLDGPINGV